MTMPKKEKILTPPKGSAAPGVSPQLDGDLVSALITVSGASLRSLTAAIHT